MKDIESDATTATYTISHHSEECSCEACGWPLGIGDTVWTDDADFVSYVACSRMCRIALCRAMAGKSQHR